MFCRVHSTGSYTTHSYNSHLVYSFYLSRHAAVAAHLSICHPLSTENKSIFSAGSILLARAFYSMKIVLLCTRRILYESNAHSRKSWKFIYAVPYITNPFQNPEIERWNQRRGMNFIYTHINDLYYSVADMIWAAFGRCLLLLFIYCCCYLYACMCCKKFVKHKREHIRAVNGICLYKSIGSFILFCIDAKRARHTLSSSFCRRIYKAESSSSSWMKQTFWILLKVNHEHNSII